MPNLDIIYDVTIAVTQDETNNNKEVIYQPTCLPSFVTFDGSVCFCLWPRLLVLEGSGGKALKTKESQAGLVRVSLFWKSHCVICVSA